MQTSWPPLRFDPLRLGLASKFNIWSNSCEISHSSEGLKPSLHKVSELESVAQLSPPPPPLRSPLSALAVQPAAELACPLGRRKLSPPSTGEFISEPNSSFASVSLSLSLSVSLLPCCRRPSSGLQGSLWQTGRKGSRRLPHASRPPLCRRPHTICAHCPHCGRSGDHRRASAIGAHQAIGA